MQPTDRIALVIPAYNEEETVGAVVRDCLAALPGASVCVVSDGSSDRCARLRLPRLPPRPLSKLKP